MIKYTRFIILLLAVTAFGAKAQVTTATSSSPYSRYGLGDIVPALLPQNLAMGGIGAAINRISGYNNINPLNPASYGAINFTTIDAGVNSNVLFLSQSTPQASATTSNFKISHVVFAIPVSRRSAISFGLLPYSEMGYNNKQSSTRNGSPGTAGSVDTVTNYLYSGDGGLSKAYFGYGFGIGKHLLIGGNVSFIFGNLTQYSSTEPQLYGSLNSRIEQSNSVRGVNYDYGIQYSFDLSDTKHLLLGYSASSGSSINSTSTYIVSQYTYDSEGNQNIPSDSLINRQSSKSKIQLPQINHFGISFQSDLKFLIGADYTMGNWSNLTIGGVNAGLQNSKTFNLGGQFTPDINSLHGYWSRTDYRLGVIYDQTYLNLNNTNIKSYAVTFGLGLPLAPNNTNLTFYKVNFSAEIGQRGTLTNGLVQEKFINFHLGFTLNDKWFQRFKFD